MKPTLTAERLREVLAYDAATGIFTCLAPALRSEFKRGDAMGQRGGTVGYQRIRVDGVVYQAHRLAWLYMTGEWPKHLIDHKNGKHRDNRWENLRDVTNRVNVENQRDAAANNGTGFLGVSRDRGYFKARIGTGGRNIHLGHFASAQEAHDAYVEAKRRLHEGCTL